MNQKACILAAILVLPLTAQPAAAAELKWIGCTTSKHSFMTAMAKAYQARTGVEIGIEDGGSTRAIRDTAAGRSDMGGSSRHKLPLDEERNARLVPVGWDAVVAIIHSENPVKHMSLAHLKAIFEGRITSWKEVGGADAPITLVVREEKAAGADLMAREFLLFDSKQDYPPSALRLKSTDQVERRVESNLHAIAFTGISSGRKRKVKFLGVDGVEPSYESITSGAYALVRPLYLVIPKQPGEQVARFVRYATGPDGQRVLRQEGTVNLIEGAGLWPKFRQNSLTARNRSE